MNSSVSPSTLANALSNITHLASQLISSNLTNLTTTPIPIQNDTKVSIPDAIHDSKGTAEDERSFSLAIFFVLSVIGKNES